MNNTITPKADTPSNLPTKPEWLNQHPEPDHLPEKQMTLHGTCETYGFRDQAYTPEIREWVRNFHEQRIRKLEEAQRAANRETWLQKLCPEHLQQEQE